jgi:hypothetical protein
MDVAIHDIPEGSDSQETFSAVGFPPIPSVSWMKILRLLVARELLRRVIEKKSPTHCPV